MIGGSVSTLSLLVFGSFFAGVGGFCTDLLRTIRTRMYVVLQLLLLGVGYPGADVLRGFSSVFLWSISVSSGVGRQVP